MMDADLLPPNQHLAAAGKWPIVGEKAPRNADEPWIVSITGLVRHPLSWTLQELQLLPQAETDVDIHCVTRWSKPGARFAGVPLAALLEWAQPLESARYVSFVSRSDRGHSTSLSLADARKLRVLVALTFEGNPIEAGHGGPIRIITPGRYFYKSLKWLERIELLADDRLGYWEAEAGYHNHADPWLEQRYVAPNLDRMLVKALMQSRDFSNRDLRSIDAAGLNLSGLNARNALLRDANFRGTNLSGACFDNGNLSNAHLERANLQGASFKNTDVEGADFCGADLRRADFTGASLFGCTFAPESVDAADQAQCALIDYTTRILPESLQSLTPEQYIYVSNRIAQE